MMNQLSDEQKLLQVIHNCHAHIFTIDHIPRYFINPFIPVTLVKNKPLAEFVYRVFRNYLGRYSAFFYSALKKTQEEILNELMGYYPTGSRLVALSIDFEYMGAGQPIKSFIEQLDELAELKAREEYKDTLLPFIGVDPRRGEKQVFDLVKKYIEEKNFTGIKLYPSIGYFPNDERLFPVYEYAEKNGIPLTTHCIPKNKNHFRNKITPEMYEKAKQVPGFDPDQAKSNYDFAQYLGHPYWWEETLKKFPKLKINLGHFGGNEEWNKYLDTPSDRKNPANLSWYKMIRNLMRNKDYPNVHADISFTVHDKGLYPILKNLLQSSDSKNYVLFGSDFYMMQKDYRERRFSMDVRGYLDDNDYWQLVDTNARRFLTSKFHDFHR